MIDHKRSKASKPLWKGITHYYRDHRNEQWYNQIQAHKRNMVTQTTVDMANIKWIWLYLHHVLENLHPTDSGYETSTQHGHL